MSENIETGLLTIDFINYGPGWTWNYCDPRKYNPYIITEDIGDIISSETALDDYLILEAVSNDNEKSPYYNLPLFFDFSTFYPIEDYYSYVLGLDKSDYDFVNVEEGKKVPSNILFNPDTEEKNVVESYKRIVYNQIKNLFYNDSHDPTKLLGMENLDTFLDNKNKLIYEYIKTITIPQKFYGESIVKNSIVVKDTARRIPYTIIDDGNGNLITQDKCFSVIVDDENKKLEDITGSGYVSDASGSNYEIYEIRKQNLGYCVSVGSTYAAIGNPYFNPQLGTGTVDIYKYDQLINDRFFYYNSLSRQTYKNTGNKTILSTDFGRSIDICDNICAISSIESVYSSSNSLVIDEVFEIVEIYDVSTTSSLPLYTISTSMIPVGFDTGSKTFGWNVSINNEFLAIGCPHTYQETTDSIYKGIVYMFSGSVSNGYKYHSFLTGSIREEDVLFGKCLALDKNYNKLIVGNGAYNTDSSNVYLFEYISGSWKESNIFTPTKKEENLSFLPVKPYSSSLNVSDGFGTSVAIYCSSSYDITVAVGCPFDRIIMDYSGSSCYSLGAVYIYDKDYCAYYSGSTSGVHSKYFEPETGSSVTIIDNGFKQTYIAGDENILKNNKFGHSVSLNGNVLIASSPKFASEYSTTYIENTFLRAQDYEGTKDYDYLGMFYVYQKDDFQNWNVLTSYKPRKLYGEPYNFYGQSVAVHNNHIVIGQPIALYEDYDGSIKIQVDKTKFAENLQGNFEIFDLSDFIVHHVGNAFYKDGKLVFSSTGSVFDRIFESNINKYYVYDFQYENAQTFYEKEIICTVNPGEFNYSTNPTSYTYNVPLRIQSNDNTKFNFNDCDKILRGMYYKLTGKETWWDLFGYTSNTSDANNTDFTTEQSLFYFYNNNTIPLSQSLTSNEKAAVKQLMANYTLDINADGYCDINDLTLLWKYFVNTLTLNNFPKYRTSKSISNNVRVTYNSVVSYLDTITAKSTPFTISPTFYSMPTGSLNPTSSFLAPYITTIGLYNQADLVAVAKLGTPIKNEGYFPLNFIVRFDI